MEDLSAKVAELERRLSSEGALEQIRSRTMAMKESAELEDVIAVVFEEAVNLGIGARACDLVIFDEVSGGSAFWISGEAQDDHVIHFTTAKLDHTHYQEGWRAWRSGECLRTAKLEGPDCQSYMSAVIQSANASEEQIAEQFQRVTLQLQSICHTEAYTSSGFFRVASEEPLREEDQQILIQFAKVFDQTYTRFLDLKRAEAQARDAQIEFALERVRSQTMAMRHSDDIYLVSTVLFQEIGDLGIYNLRCGVLNIFDDPPRCEVWPSMLEENTDILHLIGRLEMTIHPMLEGIFTAWQQQEEIFQYELFGEDSKKFYQTIANAPDYHLPFDENPDRQVCNAFVFSEGALFSFTPDYMDEEAYRIWERFRGAFSFAYSRYKDLLQAEAQAREAQIEGSLERIRARAMALRESDELRQVIALIYRELEKFDLDLYDSNILLLDIQKKEHTMWGSGFDGINLPPSFTIPHYDHAYFNQVFDDVTHYESLAEADKFRVVRLHGDLLRDLHQFYITKTEIRNAPRAFLEEFLSFDDITISYVVMEHGVLEVASGSRLPGEAEDILRRFAKAFELTYTRFLDLKRAEAQARDAQIEAALERVRSRSMAMHDSKELGEVISVVFEQLRALQIGMDSACILTFDTVRRGHTAWAANPDLFSVSSVYLPFFESPIQNDLYEARERGVRFFSKTWTLKEKNSFWKYAFKNTDYKYLPEDLKKTILSFEGWGFTGPMEKNSATFLVSYSGTPFSTQEQEVISRFGGVFEQAYTRFLDLKKAEAQARDAQIEAALERVRARSMAMHDSSELIEVATLMFREFEKLDLEAFLTCGYLIPDEAAEVTKCWFAQTQRDFLVQFDALLTGDPVLDDRYKAWKEQVPIFKYEVGGAQLAHHLQIVFPLDQRNEEENLAVVAMPDPTIFYTANFSHGYILVIADHEMDRDQERILLRFRSTFEQAYIRFLDLQKAEEQAKLAIRQSVTDRIRAEITSMRAPTDLERITPLMWKELINLGVPFFRCGIFIMDEVQRIAHTYLTTPQGESLAAIDVTFDANPLAQASVENWRRQEVYVTEWDQKQFIANMTALLDDQLLEDPDRYQHGEPAPDRLVLHLVPFRQGMLYVGNTDHLDADQIELVKLLAQTFSVAYARYEDFTELEEAKLRVESALNDLQSTQSQLVHAEKMASLGELTAGIAHEIQNPLNFVNNFSDLNKELIEDLREELKDGNIEEVEAILKDLFGNEEKILFHGKRAEEIVKSMLQHSRAGDGEKRPADINAIADEYLRLSYHGLRAKDKSFNAEFKAHLADDLPEVDVVPQDIGRVLLNLINNAFSAVSEKRALYGNGYVPTVEVFTKKLRNGIEIRVKDNGPGVPDDIREKIFQPFFTTKPTGSGTGLGLSLSYDIVTKGHGGTLEMDTAVGDGTEFRIQLPVV